MSSQIISHKTPEKIDYAISITSNQQFFIRTHDIHLTKEHGPII